MRHLDIYSARHHDVLMRTTLSVDDDLAQILGNLARESRRPFKAVVNEVLRRGLRECAPEEPPFQVIPYAGHLLPGIDERRLNEVAWDLDLDRVPDLMK